MVFVHRFATDFEVGVCEVEDLGRLVLVMLTGTLRANWLSSPVLSV